MAKTRRKYKGNAVSTTIAAGLGAGASSATITASTGWPTSGPFYAVVDPGLSTEEKIYVGTISGTSLSNITRAADDTSDQSHAAGCVIYPVFTAVDADEANELTSKYANRGSIVYQGATTFEELQKGTQGYALVIGANDPSWAQVGATGIASGAITEAKLDTGAVTADKIGAQAVTSAKLNTAVAGAGLAGGGGSALSVNVDDSTIEINADTLRVKNAGVTAEKLATDSVTTAKIAAGAVVETSLADGVVSVDKLGVESVSTTKIVDGAVTVAKLGLSEVKLRRVASQSVGTGGTPTNITWDTEDADVAGFISAPSTNITVPTGLTGLYVIGCSMTSSAGNTDQAVSIAVNGVEIESQAFGTGVNTVKFGTPSYLAAADVVTVYIRNSSSGTRTYTGTLWLTRLMD